MRTLLALLLLFAATPDDCVSRDISRLNSGSSRLGQAFLPEGNTVRFDIVGHYLNVQIGDSDLVSTPVPEDATGVTVCVDGSVDFDTPAEEPVKEPAPEPVATPGPAEPAAKEPPAPVMPFNIYEYWEALGYNVY